MTIVSRGAAAALAVLALCAGCAPVPSSAPAEPTSAAPSAGPETPTPTPTADPEPTASGVVVTAEALTIAMSDGTTGAEFSYWEPVGAVVEELTDVFGAPPAVSDQAAVNHTPPLTAYEWDGVRVLDWDTQVSPFESDWAVQVSEPDVDGVALSTVDGIRAGDSAQDVEAAYADLSWRSTPTGFPERIDARLGIVPIEATDEEWEASGMPRSGLPWFEGYDGPTEPSFAVFVTGSEPDWTVTFIAPAENFGP